MGDSIPARTITFRFGQRNRSCANCASNIARVIVRDLRARLDVQPPEGLITGRETTIAVARLDSISQRSSEAAEQCSILQTRISAHAPTPNILFEYPSGVTELVSRADPGARVENDLWVTWLLVHVRRLNVLRRVDREGANCAIFVFDDIDAAGILSDLPVGG